jgi:hypothetical protein
MPSTEKVIISKAQFDAFSQLWDAASEVVESGEPNDPALVQAITSCQAASAPDRAFDPADGLSDDDRQDAIARGREMWADDELRVDDDAMVAVADDAVWVESWVRVPNDQDED